jgi:hypothetical protein
MGARAEKFCQARRLPFDDHTHCEKHVLARSSRCILSDRRKKYAFLEWVGRYEILIAQYNLQFVFNDTWISSQYFVEFVAPDDVSTRHDVVEALGPNPVTFHRCIGCNVIAVETSETVLTLRFDNRSTLRIETEIEIGLYESGSIGTGWRNEEGRRVEYF